MNKREIKKSLKEAIEENPFKKEIKRISLFGSYLNGKPKKDSDVDLLIEFLPSSRIGFFKLVNIQNAIEHHVGKKIDLLTPESISKYFRAKVLKQAEIIYER